MQVKPKQNSEFPKKNREKSLVGFHSKELPQEIEQDATSKNYYYPRHKSRDPHRNHHLSNYNKM